MEVRKACDGATQPEIKATEQSKAMPRLAVVRDMGFFQIIRLIE
jgi:hypothetical protein